MARLSAALLGILTWSCAAFFAICYPLPDNLARGPLSPGWTWGWIIVAAGLLAWLPWMFLGSGEGRRDGHWNGLRISLSLALQIGLAIAAATFLHRDFMTLVFQAVAIHYGLFIDSAPSRARGLWRRYPDGFFFLSMLLVVFFVIWISFMGYAIATRAEPRWIPSIGYNAVNLGICFFIAATNLVQRKGARREVLVADGAIQVNDLDILPLVSEGARKLAVGVLGRGGEAFSCGKVLGFGAAESCPDDCGFPDGCPRRELAHRHVAEVGHVFSSLRIGTIRALGGERTGSASMWSFQADSSVRISVAPPLRGKN